MTRSLAAILVTLALTAPPAGASVSFTEWEPAGIPGLMENAAADDTLVMVVITQPDWCPACIHLDRTVLRNPQAEGIARLTGEWRVIEVYGYDAPGAAFLADQGLSFVGTPTTLLLKPGPGQAKLGEARQLVAIAGAPDDYVERLRNAAEGFNAIEAAQARVREVNDTDAWLALARAYLEAGQAAAARRTYQSVLARPYLDPERRREIALEAIVQPTQRVEKDHARTLEELDLWVDAYPEGALDGDYVYARVWSLLALDRVPEAQALIEEHYLAPGDADSLATYLYLAFRHPSDALLADAEARARDGIERFPEQRGRLNAAHGRILRRQGRLEAAEAAFAAAVAATDPSSPSYGTYVGQLDFVRAELGEGGA